jgi:hypothetical protein
MNCKKSFRHAYWASGLDMICEILFLFSSSLYQNKTYYLTIFENDIVPISYQMEVFFTEKKNVNVTTNSTDAKMPEGQNLFGFQ